jgi:hypothetical protein
MNECDQIVKAYGNNFSNVPKLMFDIGANLGRVARDVVSVYDDIEVYAFEPYPEIFKMLHENNPSFSCHQLAISDFNGFANFYLRPILDEDRGKNQVTCDSYLLYRPEYGFFNDEVVQVEVSTASNFIANNNFNETFIDIVKIDVEGAGLQVIDGFSKDIERVKLIHIELENFEIWHGQAVAPEVINKLNSLGFHLVDEDKNDVQTNAVFVNSKLRNI